MHLKNKSITHISTINSYALTENAEEKEKVEFYKRLAHECERSPKWGNKMILTDLNANNNGEGEYYSGNANGN